MTKQDQEQLFAALLVAAPLPPSVQFEMNWSPVDGQYNSDAGYFVCTVARGAAESCEEYLTINAKAVLALVGIDMELVARRAYEVAECNGTEDAFWCEYEPEYSSTMDQAIWGLLVGKLHPYLKGGAYVPAPWESWVGKDEVLEDSLTSHQRASLN